jgi:hypothetical protein
MPQAKERSTRATEVTPHATDNLPDGPAMGLYVGGLGNVVADCGMNGDTTFLAVPAGTTIMTQFNAIRSTSTATGMVALY